MTGSLTDEEQAFKPGDFSSYVTAQGNYVRVRDPRPRPAAYRINVKFKPDRTRLRYFSECQMFVVEP